MDQNRFWNLLAKQLSKEASGEELAELEELMKKHPELCYSAQHLSDLWRLQPKQDAKQAAPAFQEHVQHLNDFPLISTSVITKSFPYQSKRSYASAVRYALFALPVMALCLFLLLKSGADTSLPAHIPNAEISTRLGSRTKLVLPDSSVVWLNAGSKLTYDRDFGQSNRNTVLTGEAFFDVKKMAVPFIIQANAVKIKVLGTAFNVKSYPNEPTTETSLVRGRVEITIDKRPGEKFILKPNEKLIVANYQDAIYPGDQKKKGPLVVLKELTHINDTTIVETSWVENRLIFQDESFEEVARKMERWYNVKIDIKDDKLAQMQVGGGPFENESIEQALIALKIAFNFKFSIKGNAITITN